MAKIAGLDKTMDKLRSWAEREEWRELFGQTFAEHLMPACDGLEIEPEELLGLFDEHHYCMVLGTAFEDFLTCEFGDDSRNLIDHYLARRGWNLPAGIKRWLKTLRDSHASLWEVVDVDPGRSITLRDLLAGGEPLVVDERSGSKSVMLWDRLMARMVHVGGVNYLTGATLLYQPEAAEAALARFDDMLKSLRREARKVCRQTGESPPDDEAVRAFLATTMAPILTEEWLVHYYQAATAPPPTLLNSDGEPYLSARLRFPLTAEADQVAARLDRCEVLARYEEDLYWDWIAAYESASGAAPTEPEHPGKVLRLESHDVFGRTVLGTLRIAGNELVLEVNSRERAERGRVLLSETLGGMLGEAEITLRSLEELADGAGDEPASAEPELPPDARAELMTAYFDEYYGRILDEPIPMLGGKSPRQAARSKKTRADVVNWLKTLENNELRRARAAGEPVYDPFWLWVELGLTELRQ